MCEYAKANEVDFSQCHFVGLDEFVGLSWADEGSCFHYVNKHFFQPLYIPSDRIHFFKANSGDLRNECDKTDSFINEHGGIDVLLLGVGVNGHLALNEPYVSIDLNYHVIKLDETTKRVGRNYFSQDVKLEKGITIGLKQMLEAKIAIVIANGKMKREAISALLKGKADEKYPISSLDMHENCFVFIDQEANQKS